MIYNDNFIWSHLGKTGGNFTRTLFEAVNKGDLTIVPKTLSKKHTEVKKIMELTPAKNLIVNFRKLPTLCLSFYKHQSRHSRNRAIDVATPEALDRGELTNNGVTPDGYLRQHYIEELQSDPDINQYFIRTENIVEDFIEVVGKVYHLTNEDIEKVRQLGKSNFSRGERGATVYDEWSPDRIQTFYDKSPLWAKLEKQLY